MAQVGIEAVGCGEPLLSVVVPTYNGEEFLAECLESILCQTMGDFELICVDDGSTDSTPQLLATYAERDARVRVLSQENAGAGPARNAGLARARGRYVLFLDDDDWFEPEMFELMSGALERDGADLCVCDAYRYDMRLGSRERIRGCLKSEFLPEELPFAVDEFAQGGHLFDFANFFAWTKMCRRGMLVEHGIQFRPYRTSEDAIFTFDILLAARTITVVDRPLATYRVGTGASLSDTVSDDMLAGYRALVEAKQMLIDHGVYYGPYQQSFANRAISHLVYAGNHAATFDSLAEWYHVLKSEGFERLGLLGHDASYFYKPVYYERIQSVMGAATAEDFVFLRCQQLMLDRDRKAAAASASKATVRSLRAKSRGQHDRIVGLKERNARLKARNEELKAMVWDLRAKSRGQHDRIVGLKERNARLKAKNDELKATVEGLKEELARIKGSRSYRLAMRLRRVAKKLGL